MGAAPGSLKARVVGLYTGASRQSQRLRYGLILFDLATVLYFIVTVPMPPTPLIITINIALAVLIAVDMVCRFWISDDRWRHLLQVYVIADILVLGSLVLNPFLHVDLTFLRILRGVRLGQSEYLLRDLRRDWPFFLRNEDAMVAALNLFVFVFATTSAVHTFFANAERGWAGYVDALYFTVTTLTTTGYGDLTPTTTGGKLFAVAIMAVGVSLFLRLASAVFSPPRVHHPCPRCGLTRHEPDAVHCKHCGEVVRIETRGA